MLCTQENLEKIKAIYDFEKTVFLEKEKRKLNASREYSCLTT